MKKKIILISIILLISISLIAYKNINKFNNNDIYFGYYNGNEKLDEMPSKDNSVNLVFDYASCDNDAYVLWDEKEWAPLVKNLSKSKTKCTLYFRQASGIEFIKNISTIESGDGLYKVSHNVSEINKEWNRTEYRYAGINPNNYVRFNNEIWRVIGVVNVKTEKGVEQRIKIVRTDGIDAQKDFGSYVWDRYVNNWNTSTLKDMLNGIYYESTIGECFPIINENQDTQNECDFTGNSNLPKGLDETARKMIDKEVIWNIGGVFPENDVLVNVFYEKERGTVTGNSNYLSEWNNKTDTLRKYNGIALIYPSDYGYATNGGILGREKCFTKELYNWENNVINYQSECAGTDWLKPIDGDSWCLTPNSSYSRGAFYISLYGYVRNSGLYNKGVWPTLYLKSTVKILPNSNPEQEYGSEENPFVIE